MIELYVRPAEIMIARKNAIIHSPALGSSLGICLYDPSAQIGGFVHSILPQQMHQKSQDLKYVDIAIFALYQRIIDEGADPDHLYAKIVGGAKLFQFPNTEFEVGEENVKTARLTLEQLHIPIIAEDVGDLYGRSIHFHTKDGIVMIETRNKHMYQI